MDRKARRKDIEQLVSERKIETQDELLKLLNDAGIETTQATISRDIHMLNIVKASDGTGHTYYVQLQKDPAHNYDRLYLGIHNNVQTVETVQFLNVVKTEPNSSYATILAGMFDELDVPEVIGTLAGNDTLILISKTPEDAQAVNKLITDHLD